MGVVDEGQMKKKAADLFRKLGMTVNLTQPMRNMSVSQRQMCEIAKAISYNAQVIDDAHAERTGHCADIHLT